MFPHSHHLTENAVDSPVLPVPHLEAPLFFSLGVPIGCMTRGWRGTVYWLLVFQGEKTLLLGLSPPQHLLSWTSARSQH